MFFKKLLSRFKKSKKFTLESEFEQFKATHKYNILLAVAKKYYIDLQQSNGVNIPVFMQANIAIQKQKMTDNKITFIGNSKAAFFCGRKFVA